MESPTRFMEKSKSWVYGRMSRSTAKAKHRKNNALRVFQLIKDYESEFFQHKRHCNDSSDQTNLRYTKPLPQCSSETKQTTLYPRFESPVSMSNSLSLTNSIQCSIIGKYPQCKLQDFEIEKILGTGEFSKVYLASHKAKHSQIALKVLSKDIIKTDKLECQVLREINIQSRLKHPNIVQLYTFFCDHKNIYLVLEYVAGGELYTILHNTPDKRFNNQSAAKYIYQVTDALQYCHHNKVIHRDLKPENLILDLDDNVKLSDFGWSVCSPKSKRKTLCGTVDYIAPEMIEEQYYDELVDNWCLGVLCYEFLVGKPPFHTSSKEKEDTFKNIIMLNIKYPNFICHRAKDLISKLLVKNPNHRLSLQQVKEHDWITYFVNDMSTWY